MGELTDEVNDALDRVMYRSLIDAAERCECGQPCYCASNIEFAERKIVEIDKKVAARAALSSEQEK